MAIEGLKTQQVQAFVETLHRSMARNGVDGAEARQALYGRSLRIVEKSAKELPEDRLTMLREAMAEAVSIVEAEFAPEVVAKDAVPEVPDRTVEAPAPSQVAQSIFVEPEVDAQASLPIAEPAPVVALSDVRSARDTSSDEVDDFDFVAGRPASELLAEIAAIYPARERADTVVAFPTAAARESLRKVVGWRSAGVVLAVGAVCAAGAFMFAPAADAEPDAPAAVTLTSTTP